MDKETLIKQLKNYNWDETNVRIAIRAKCRCEYCEKKMLSSIENYKLWQIDHIIPKSYIDTNFNHNDFDNKALSCTQCNKDFKNKWNPADKIGINKSRIEYIDEIKIYIEEKRKKKKQELIEIKKMFKIYFNANKDIISTL